MRVGKSSYGYDNLYFLKFADVLLKKRKSVEHENSGKSCVSPEVEATLLKNVNIDLEVRDSFFILDL